MIRNNCGAIGKQVIGFGYIFLLLIVGVGLVAGAGIFYGKDIDFREIEARELAGKIMECILNDNLDLSKIKENGEEMYKKCGIDKAVIEKYFIIQIKRNEQVMYRWGDAVACELKGAEDNLYYPRCAIKNFEKGNEGIEVLAGSKQLLRRELS